MGTPCYFAPEVLQKEEYGNPIDMWGVGCILYEVMTLDFLWTRKGMLSVQVMSKPFRPQDFPKYYGYEFRELACQLLDPTPARRPLAADAQAAVSNILKSQEDESPKARARAHPLLGDDAPPVAPARVTRQGGQGGQVGGVDLDARKGQSPERVQLRTDVTMDEVRGWTMV